MRSSFGNRCIDTGARRVRLPAWVFPGRNGWHMNCLSSRFKPKGDVMKALKILIAGTAIALLPFAAAVAQTPPADPAAQSRESTQPTAPAQSAQKGVTF